LTCAYTFLYIYIKYMENVEYNSRPAISCCVCCSIRLGTTTSRIRHYYYSPPPPKRLIILYTDVLARPPPTLTTTTLIALHLSRDHGKVCMCAYIRIMRHRRLLTSSVLDVPERRPTGRVSNWPDGNISSPQHRHANERPIERTRKRVKYRFRRTRVKSRGTYTSYRYIDRHY